MANTMKKFEITFVNGDKSIQEATSMEYMNLLIDRGNIKITKSNRDDSIGLAIYHHTVKSVKEIE